MVAYKYPGPAGVAPNWGNATDLYHGSIGISPYWEDSFDRGLDSPWPGILEDIREGRKEWLELQRTMTGQESRIAGLLRSPLVDHVNFAIGQSWVNKAMMEIVAKAIEWGSIKILLGSSGKNLRASYSSNRPRVKSSRTRGRTGELTVKISALPTHQGQVDVFHESVHALKDILRYKINGHEDEALAFMADTLFWLSLNKTLPKRQQVPIPTEGDAAPIYAATTALVLSKDMLTSPGTVLNWSECSELLKAIKSHPHY